MWCLSISARRVAAGVGQVVFESEWNQNLSAICGPGREFRVFGMPSQLMFYFCGWIAAVHWRLEWYRVNYPIGSEDEEGDS